MPTFPTVGLNGTRKGNPGLPHLRHSYPPNNTVPSAQGTIFNPQVRWNVRSSRYNHTRTKVRMCQNNNQLTPFPPPSRCSPLTQMQHLLQALDLIKVASESRPRISPGIETHPYPVHLCLHLETIIFVISICMHVCTYPIHTLQSFLLSQYACMFARILSYSYLP